MSNIVEIIKHPEQHTDGRVMVVPIETGGGKSRITNKVLAELTQTDLRNSGTILLKQRIEDCHIAVAAINSMASKEVARSYYGTMFNKGSSRQFQKEKDYVLTLYSFPILVMTHEMFKTRYKKLGEFMYWVDPDMYSQGVTDVAKIINDTSAFGNRIKYLKRERLIIDEQPDPLNLVKITMANISAIEDYVQKSGNQSLFNEICSVTNYIKRVPFMKRTDMVTQYWHRPKGLGFSNDVIDYFKRGKASKITAGVSVYDIFIGLGLFCNDGGFVNYSDDTRYKYITTASYVDIFDTAFHTIILDGTAIINYIYENKVKFDVKDIPITKTYHNTTLDISWQFSGSRTEINENGYIIPKLRDFIMNKVGNEQALIITHKEFEAKFNDLGMPSNISIDHYGNITGTNKYRLCKYLFVVGMNFLYDDVYKIYYHVYFNNEILDKSQKVKTVNGVRRFEDVDYNAMKISMIASGLIQAINRVRCRETVDGDTPETYIFLLNKDPDIVNLIKKAMPGIKITSNMDFYASVPVEHRKPRQQSAIDVLLHILNGFIGNCKISKSELMSLNEYLIKLTKQHKARLWKHPSVLQMEAEGKIRIHHREIEFIGG